MIKDQIVAADALLFPSQLVRAGSSCTAVSWKHEVMHETLFGHRSKLTLIMGVLRAPWRAASSSLSLKTSASKAQAARSGFATIRQQKGKETRATREQVVWYSGREA